ncbi:MAG: acyl carrier protein [Rhizobiales bacterium]|nr:acyl carrier protein [Hyphomicrobiales bacterium]
MHVAAVARNIIASQLRVPAERVTDDARWGEDLGADELERVEVVMAIEQAFHVDIDDAAIESFATVGDLLRWLGHRVQ